jgi:hypothetical protein
MVAGMTTPGKTSKKSGSGCRVQHFAGRASELQISARHSQL